MKRIISLSTVLLLALLTVNAQDKSLVNTSESPFAKVTAPNITDVVWTGGFWGERSDICMNSMVPHMLEQYLDDSVSHAYLNFRIAAGLEKGEHVGPPFHDGDFYKILEGLVMSYAQSPTPEKEKQLDEIIDMIGRSQREDGYIHTPVAIESRMHPEKKHEFSERLDFETYNMGHLMTLACLHNRVTDKENLLDIAKNATDFLYRYYKEYPAKLADNAICPSHYMGVTEMYRTTGEPRYKELAQGLIDIRNMVTEGTDHNQDRTPFKQQTQAIGHAVRANYLYAGAADVYTETGDDSILTALEHIWNDVVSNKLYITGACGALYDGVSPNGTTYQPSEIQQVHQAYGRPYELPNLTAHNESCANIGNLLWNWRMFAITGKAQYIDILEEVAYNSLLAAVSLDGINHFYTNPLSVNHAHGLSDSLRWSKEREPYISYCNCCPPNTSRTIAQMQSYAYAVSDNDVWVNLYGSNKLNTTLPSGEKINLSQTSQYPWDGNISIKIQEDPNATFNINLRIPAWVDEYTVKVNGKKINTDVAPGNFLSVKRKWTANDEIEIEFPMDVKLMAANPLVEATRNQVAVKRGPVVYCIEEADVPEETILTNIAIPVKNNLKPEHMAIGESNFMVLKGKATIIQAGSPEGKLYNELKPSNRKTNITLVPYYTWGNRGRGNMSVWLPVSN
ncbi:MAG: glycoside hydrolase family 127 protein [Prolixibacteraceae bacterium]|jgi:DUF1680 family protein|nr:glycoside hydrolase family 127 protein [Prolixibacteraceae bacterium]